MSAATVTSILLGAGGSLTGIYAVLNQVRDRRRHVVKQEGEIQLNDTTRVRIASEAAQINSDERIATERWWKEQFDAVKDELVEEQTLRRRLTKWAKAHQEWDQQAWTLALKSDPLTPGPPQLEIGDLS